MMDASGGDIDWRARSTVCRCCLAPGCYKDLDTEYFCSGQREVFADMLKETFNIEFSYQEGAGGASGSRHICEVCVRRLRDAAAFKRQALSSEARLLEHLATLNKNKAQSLMELLPTEPPIKSAASVNMETQTENEDSSDGELIINIDDNELPILRKALTSEPPIKSAASVNVETQTENEDSSDDELIIDETLEEHDSSRGDNQTDKSTALRTVSIDDNGNQIVTQKHDVKVQLAEKQCLDADELPTRNIEPLEKNNEDTGGPLTPRYHKQAARPEAQEQLPRPGRTWQAEHKADHSLKLETPLLIKLLQSPIKSAINVKMETQVKNEDSSDGELIVDESSYSEEHDRFEADNYADKSSAPKTMSIDVHETLTNVKIELEENEVPVADERPTQCIEEPVETNNENTGVGQGTEDCVKMARVHTNGPMLRDMTLKLLANSTMCVFQWRYGRYRCFCCHQPYSDLTALREHTSTHPLGEIEKKIIMQQNSPVKVDITHLFCKLCFKNLSNLSELRLHLTDSHKVKFHVPDDLLVPFKLNNELKCQLCGDQFTVFPRLNRHMNKHFLKETCNICGGKFASKAILYQHKSRSHKPPRCGRCDRRFTNATERAQHEFNVHGEPHSRKLNFPCPYCKREFFHESHKIKHTISDHGIEKPEYQCNQCSCKFKIKFARDAHVSNMHVRNRKIICAICYLTFITKLDLYDHMVSTHKRESVSSNFKCNFCLHSFASQTSLNRHLKTIHEESAMP